MALAPSYSVKGGNLLFVTLCGVTCLKGAVPLLHTDELYFWLNTYEFGAVRRATIGTILAPFTSSVSGSSLFLGLYVLHVILLAALLLTARVLVERLQTTVGQPTALTIGLLWAASPYLGQLAYHAGYPDVLLFLLLATTLRGLRSATGPVIASLLVLMCLIDDLGFLLLLPLAAFGLAVRTDTKARHWLWLAVGSIFCITITLFSPQPGAGLIAALVHSGKSVAEAHAEIDGSVGRSLRMWMVIMLGVWRIHYTHALVGITYAVLPGLLVMILGAPVVRATAVLANRSYSGRALVFILYAGACLGPCALLTIALDLSRVASFSTATAFLAVSNLPSRTGIDSARSHGSNPIAIACSLAVAGAFFFLPIFDLHFDAGMAINLMRVNLICPPCAAVGIFATSAYDKAYPSLAIEKLEHDRTVGN